MTLSSPHRQRNPASPGNSHWPSLKPRKWPFFRPRSTEDRRKELFLALVDAQDHEMSVAQSRTLMAQQFGVSESQVRQIEREGMELEWPPLG